LDRANDAEQHAAGDTAPRTILQPRLAFEAFFAFDLALGQGRVGRRARCALRHQPARGRAKRQRIVSSS
jgi:hypothetical protein